MDRALDRRRLMFLRRPGARVLMVLLLLLTAARFASALECIRVSFKGETESLKDAVLRQLQTELTLPIYPAEAAVSCPTLILFMESNTAKIWFENNPTEGTSIELGDFPPHLWPRAAALAVAGLLVRAGDRPVAPPPPDTAAPENAQPKSSSPQVSPSPPPPAAPTTEVLRRDDPPEPSGPVSRIRIPLMLGVRLMPSLSVGVLDFAAGVGIVVGDIYFDLNVMGIWGRTSVSAGNIVTCGGGIRGAVFWQGMKRPHTSLGIGPAVEILGVFGYGRGNDGVASHQGGRPVVNVLLLAGGAFTLTPETAMHIVIGGGYSALYFDMRRDGDTVSGFRGASVNVGIGVSFGVSTRRK